MAELRAATQPQSIFARNSGEHWAGRLYVRRYVRTRPGLAPLRLRTVRDAELGFRTNGVLLNGIGPQ